MATSIKNKIETLDSRNAEIATEIEALGEVETSDDDANQSALNVISELSSEFDKNENELKVYAAAYEKTKQSEARKINRQLSTGSGSSQPDGSSQASSDFPWENQKISARVAYQKSKHFASNKEAYFAGLFYAAAAGNITARDKLVESGYKMNPARGDMSITPNTAGGFTVPEPLEATIIRLVEEAGVFRRSARVIPMTSNTLDVPQRTGGLTVEYPGEGGAITNSDLTFGQVNLVAKKYAVLALMSTELEEDSIISMVDLVTEEIAYAIAVAEDTNSFLGDGTAAFGGITGIANALAAGSQLALNVNWALQTLDEFTDAVAALPLYAGIQPAWYINHSGYAASMQRLLYAAGGNTGDNVAGGMPAQFLGYPVYFTQVLSGLGAVAGDLTCVFGDLRMGAIMGIRRSLTIKVLNELYAASDQAGRILRSSMLELQPQRVALLACLRSVDHMSDSFLAAPPE